MSTASGVWETERAREISEPGRSVGDKDCNPVRLCPATYVSFLRSGNRILAAPSAAGGRFTSHESQVTNYGISTRHCVPSRFRANSFKTKDRRTRYPTQIEGGPQHRKNPDRLSTNPSARAGAEPRQQEISPENKTGGECQRHPPPGVGGVCCRYPVRDFGVPAPGRFGKPAVSRCHV